MFGLRVLRRSERIRLNEWMRIARVLVTGVLTGTMLFAGLSLGLFVGSTATHADVVSVDPGKSLSANRPIVGTSQNLPSVGAVATWNIGSFPAELINTYYESGSALRDQRDVATAARVWSKKWVNQTCGGIDKATVRKCKVAAVFDIDDTLLSSFPTLSTNSPAFTFSQSAFDQAAVACTGSVIEPVKNLYLSLQRMGVGMILITGRSESLRDSTANCLRQAGITNWQQFILRQPGDTDLASVYKVKARKSLIKKGWQIGPSVGDQVSDMSYGALEHGFLIPNPMYFIP